VAVDSAAFERLGGRQPIPREYLARVVRGLARCGASVVGIDITFASPTEPRADAALAEAIREFSDHGVSRVVLLGPLSAGSEPLGAAALGVGVLTASPLVSVPRDGIIRRVDPLLPGPDGTTEPTLALALVARQQGLDRRALDARLASGQLQGVTLARDAGWPINYVGPAGSFFTISSDQLAPLGDPGAESPATDNPFRGRIVLVGGTFPEGRDTYQTPYGPMPGVEVHANVAHMLTTGRFIRPSSWWVGLAVNVAVSLVAGVVLLTLRPLIGTLVCIGGALAIGVPAAFFAFNRGGYWIDFVLPVVATTVTGLGGDALDRRRFRDSFSRYLSRDVMARVLTDAPSLRGEHRDVSILFSDLRGFTTLSEQLPPERIASHLSEYFEAMTTAIFAHHGMINDFVGDAVMAVFGAPVTDPEHAWHAVQSARDMDRALERLNQSWDAAGLPRLRMGIGIHTGPVFAGNVGGRDRIKYTVIGDPVNVASRVEGLNKELGTTILITEDTLAAVGERVRTRDCGPQAVKGRVEKVQVFEVLTDEEGRT
jgi:class 3 adenylate cyclase/CHASE2 domain-containing sensor protein